MSATMFAPDCTLTLATSQLLRTTPYLWAIFQAARSGCAQTRMLRHRLRLTQAPHDSASAAHPWEATRLGATLDTWHTPTSFACESLHCTVPWQGDRWVPYGLHMPGPRGVPTVAARPPKVSRFSTTRPAEQRPPSFAQRRCSGLSRRFIFGYMPWGIGATEQRAVI